MPARVCAFLWTLLYFLFRLVSFIESIWIVLKRFSLEHFYRFTLKDELEFVSTQVKVLNKIPSHLVVILGNETVSHKDLANMTVWCIAAGISFVSFYDHDGALKRNEVELFKALSSMNKGYLENIRWKRSPMNGIVNGTKNGTVVPHKTQVSLLSYADGKGGIVEMAREMSVSASTRASDITQQLMSCRLQEKLGMPDPDLALYCGPACCTYGLLPWHVRVTQFLQLRTHHRMNVVEFVFLLRMYSRSEQRLGK